MTILPSLQRDEAVVEIGGRDRDVLAEPERVVLVDPGVVARLGAVVSEAFKARAGIFVERPAFRAMIAGRGRSVERTFALAAVEAARGGRSTPSPTATPLLSMSPPRTPKPGFGT